MDMIIKGIILGFIVVLPGMSGGTLLLIMGIYEKLLRDLSRLRILSWIPFIFGAGGGILLSGIALTWMLQEYRDIVSAFLLGSILASVKPVLGEHFQFSTLRTVLFLVGGALGLLLAGEPIGIVDEMVAPSLGLLFFGGAVASAAMLVPGIPGSSMLIVLGIYDSILRSLARLDWVTLVVFAAGAVVGIFGLANALDKLFTRYRAPLGWFFAGLIIGSGRMLLPAFDTPVLIVLAMVVGFSAVWIWGDYKINA